MRTRGGKNVWVRELEMRVASQTLTSRWSLISGGTMSFFFVVSYPNLKKKIE